MESMRKIGIGICPVSSVCVYKKTASLDAVFLYHNIIGFVCQKYSFIWGRTICTKENYFIKNGSFKNFVSKQLEDFGRFFEQSIGGAEK